jgi:hypothetical protein
MVMNVYYCTRVYISASTNSDSFNPTLLNLAFPSSHDDGHCTVRERCPKVALQGGFRR